MRNLLRTIRLLRNASNADLIAPFLDVHIPDQGKSLSAALFQPDGNPPHPALLLSHGFTLTGNREPRILQLASGLRAIGFTVLVPNFPEAEELKVTPETKRQVVRSFEYLSSLPEVNRDQMGIFGISYGATLAFLAAADRSIQERVAWIVSLGAYVSMEDLVAFGRTAPDPFVREIISRNPEAAQWFPELSIPADFHLSPKTKVILLHSKNDPVVPWREMKRLESILKQRETPFRSYLVQLDGHARITSIFAGFQTFLAARAIVGLQG